MHDTNGTDTILHHACNWKSAPHSPIVGMLIEFSVANFRSIKDEVRLSLVAGPGKEHAASILTVGSRAETAVRPIRLLPSVAIYGANAAGKTNVIRGLKTMHDIVLGSAASGPAELPVTPFRFDPACSDQPTTFEVMCIADGVRYQYGFRATRNEVTDEWLYAWPSGRLQVWFERRNREATGEPSWKLGGKLTGDRQVWKRATRPQALFLSTAVSLNSTQLLPVFDWFRKRLHVAGVGGWSPGFSVNYAKNGGADVLGFLAAADLAVTGLRIVEKEIPPDQLPEEMPAELKTLLAQGKAIDIFLQHQPKEGQQAELDMDEESHGTQKMFALAGPWIDSLAEGNVIVFDELHDNLHPALVRFLVSRFHDPTANQHGAQLVFTTHDTSLLDRDLFRLDQIWLCERNDRLETSLFPLSDFQSLRSIVNLERAYLAGRFGALPYIRSSDRSSD